MVAVEPHTWCLPESTPCLSQEGFLGTLRVAAAPILHENLLIAIDRPRYPVSPFFLISGHRVTLEMTLL